MNKKAIMSAILLCALLTGCTTGSNLTLKSVEFPSGEVGVKSGHIFETDQETWSIAGQGTVRNAISFVNVLMINCSDEVVCVLGDSLYGRFSGGELGYQGVCKAPTVKSDGFGVVEQDGKFFIEPRGNVLYRFELLESVHPHPKKTEMRTFEFVHRISSNGEKQYKNQCFKLNFFVWTGRRNIKKYSAEYSDVLEVVFGDFD